MNFVEVNEKWFLLPSVILLSSRPRPRSTHQDQDNSHQDQDSTHQDQDSTHQDQDNSQHDQDKTWKIVSQDCFKTRQ
jgi:hypothetical protein